MDSQPYKCRVEVSVYFKKTKSLTAIYEFVPLVVMKDVMTSD